MRPTVKALAYRLWGEIRATTDWQHLIIPGIVALVLYDLLITPQPYREIGRALLAMELLLPLAAGVLVAEAVGRDWAENAAEWRITLPGGPLLLVGLRATGALVLWATLGLGFLAAVQAFYLPPGQPFPFRAALGLLGPPGLFLAGVALAATLAGRSSIPGFVAATAYWMSDWLSGGRYFGPLHLHYLWAPLERVGYEANRWWLLAAAAAVAAVAMAAFRRGEWWIR